MNDFTFKATVARVSRTGSITGFHEEDAPLLRRQDKRVQKSVSVKRLRPATRKLNITLK